MLHAPILPVCCDTQAFTIFHNFSSFEMIVLSKNQGEHLGIKKAELFYLTELIVQ